MQYLNSSRQIEFIRQLLYYNNKSNIKKGSIVLSRLSRCLLDYCQLALKIGAP